MTSLGSITSQNRIVQKDVSKLKKITVAYSTTAETAGFTTIGLTLSGTGIRGTYRFIVGSISVTAVQTGSDSALGNQPSYLDITGLDLDVVAGSPIDITAQVSDDTGTVSVLASLWLE